VRCAFEEERHRDLQNVRDVLQTARADAVCSSYFCTCWNVIPSPSPSVPWLIPSIFRRIRIRLPTCLSTGLANRLIIACFTIPPKSLMLELADAKRQSGAIDRLLLESDRIVIKRY